MRTPRGRGLPLSSLMGNTGWCGRGKQAAELEQNHQSFFLGREPTVSRRQDRRQTDRQEAELKRRILQSGAVSQMCRAWALETGPKLCSAPTAL